MKQQLPLLHPTAHGGVDGFCRICTTARSRFEYPSESAAWQQYHACRATVKDASRSLEIDDGGATCADIFFGRQALIPSCFYFT